MSNAAFRLLWCFVFVLPWDAFTYVPVLGSIPRLVGLGVSAVGVLYIVARRRIRPLSWFHALALLFVLWTGVTSFWSIDPEATRERFRTYLQLLLLVWLIWEVAWSPERGRGLLQAYVLGACVAAGATVLSYLTGVSGPVPLDAEAARVVALNQDPNELGVILALGLPMAWYLGLAPPQRRTAWMWQLYAPLGITAILLTASRGAFLAAVAALVIVPWTLGRLRLRTKAVLCALAVGSFALATRFVPEVSLERIGSTRADIAAGYFGGRGEIWKVGLQVAQEHPLAGVGAGAFGAAVEPTLRRERASHQVLLAILVEDGVVGLCLFLAMVMAAIQPLRGVSLLQRRFGIVLLLTVAVGSLSLEWDHRKQLWFVLAVLAGQLAQRAAGKPVPPAGTVRIRPAPLR